MEKPKAYSIAASNIATLGTEAKTKAQSTDKEVFANAGKEIGLQIWRIEKFKAVPWPKEEYGFFFLFFFF